MKLLEQSPEVRSVFAFWQVFRELGFPSEHLHVGIVEGRLLLNVRPPGFSISMGSTAMAPEDFETAWRAFADALPELPEEDLESNYQEFVTEERWTHLVLVLAQHGVPIPAQRPSTGAKPLPN